MNVLHKDFQKGSEDGRMRVCVLHSTFVGRGGDPAIFNANMVWLLHDPSTLYSGVQMGFFSLV